MSRPASLLLFFIFSCVKLCAQSKENSDSLWHAYTDLSSPDTSRIDALQKFTWNILRTNPDSGLKLSQVELEYATRIHNKEFQGEAYNNMGVCYKNKEAFTIAIDCYLKCLKLWEEINYSAGVASTYSNMGIVMHHLGNDEKALEYYQKSLALKNKDSSSNNKTAGKRALASTYFNMGNAYAGLHKDSLALIFFQKGADIILEIKDEKGEISAYANLGLAYSNLGETEKAIQYYTLALTVSRKFGDKSSISNTLNNLGQIYVVKKDYRRAIDTCMLAYALAMNGGKARNVQNSCECLSEAYAGLGQFEKSLFYYKKSVQIKDSLVNQDKRDEITRKEVEYIYIKKAATDSTAAAQELNLNNAKLEGEKKLRYALYIGLGLVLLFSGFIFNRFRITRKQKVVIEKQQAETEAQKEIIEKKNKDILDSIHYAKRIQGSLLPTEKYIDRNLGRLKKE